MNIHHITCLS